VARTPRGVTGFGQSGADPKNQRTDRARFSGVFAFFSNRLGCLGSIIVSVIGTLLLLALMRGCSGGGAVW
jgi:hypothetical protein